MENTVPTKERNPSVSDVKPFSNQKESENGFVCKYCEKTFVHQKSFKAHVLSHAGAFSCSVCFKNFSNAANLNIHSRIHSGQKPFKCELCPLCFRTSSMRKRHVAKIHCDKIKFPLPTYECPNCNRKLRSHSSFQKHVARHNIQNLLVCELCQVDCFTHEAYLAHHKRCHSGEKGKTVLEKLQKNKCHICSNSFYTISALWDHATLYHAPFLGLPCSECGKVNSSKNAYMTHRRTHIEVKDYICQVCEKRFNKASHLQDHVRVHVQDYTYKCPVCSKGFLRPKNLKTHLLAKHRPTVDTCCLRTLQRRKKIYEMENNASSNSISGSSTCSINSNSRDFSSTDGSSSDSSSISHTSVFKYNESNTGRNSIHNNSSPSLRLRIKPIVEIKKSIVKSEIIVKEEPECTHHHITDSCDRSFETIQSSSSNLTFEHEKSSFKCNPTVPKNEHENFDNTFLQISAFPKFDWKRVPTTYADEPTQSPYVDVRGHPLFSKNKPAPMTKKLVDMAKSSKTKQYRRFQ